MSAQSVQVMERNNGVGKVGELDEIAEFSGEMKSVLESICGDEEDIEDFDFWRPKRGDDEKEIKCRTTTVASLSEKGVESESRGFKEDLSDAKEDLKRKMKQFDGDYSEASFKSEVMGPVKKLFRPFASASLQFIREMEELIYSFMLNFNPYYFDAEKFSVSLEKEGEEFEINFKSPEEEYRRAVKQRFDVGE